MRASLTEFVGGLSLATDMGAGLPLQSAIAATILAVRMATRFGLPSEATRETFYSSILRFIGCSAAAPEAAQLGLGDDSALNYALAISDFTDPAQVTASVERYAAPHAAAEARRELARSFPAQLGVVAEAAAMHCTQAVLLSRRLPVGDGVLQSLGHMYDRFDGKMSRVSGHAIPMPARLAALAADTAIMLRSLGKNMALEVVLSRRGGQYCPECCDLLAAEHPSLLAGLDAPSCWDAYLDSAPAPNVQLEGETLERACTAYADYADQKSGFLLGHSRRVANLTFAAAECMRLDLGDRNRLRLAAMLHDVGRAGVPTGLWDKKGSFTEHERQLVRAHSALTETVLKLAPGLSRLGESATHVHERGDRSGYPRSATLSDVGAGLLAAADVYEAVTHDRPWRQAYTAERAADLMVEEARSGRIPQRAVDAVLGAAGHGKRRSEDAYPAGLSRREVEVLALLAQGLSTKEIAARISVAPKTAENHVTNIYAKTGVRGRASAALFAVEHGLHHRDHGG